ncbi:serine hydrolase domain-containing protein [Actinophytocola gossypii]|uniref:Beta-lactamase family protein n=1 Tax=Actinophytocola gossypii TaxID=2812003 RepID=A0ABT2J536_9PSEU|nr:serine hydrolase domain-containing protein [Actinophytocola gossypii]MCT2582903.1 beta-lactamase family protein [Actinophytocola gossypii]
MFRSIVISVAALAGLAAACTPAPPAEPADPPADAVQHALDRLVAEDGYPGALAAVRGADGETRDYTAGVGDLRTGAEMPVNGRVRLASNTKTFTATVVLQLVGEGRVDLDAPVETYLPGVVRGQGVDGRRITVRQLLSHTSGLVDYDDKLVVDYLEIRHRHYEPRELLDVVLAEPALFPPGARFSYSNANYVLAGLIVQRVTGRPVGEEITERIIEPLGLRDTYWPELGDQTIHGPHPHGYLPTGDGGLAAGEGAGPVDVTVQDTSLAWAAGALIGTPRDLNTFLTALLDGELLRPAELKEMRTTVPAPDFHLTAGGTYGLGLGTFPLSCGASAWTHGGDAPGYVSRTGVTDDGRAATVVVTGSPTSLPAAERVERALDTALCG